MTTPEVTETAVSHGLSEYRSQAARDAEARGYGSPRFCAYLDQTAIRHHAYWLRQGSPAKAESMLTRSLGEALAGNDGA